MNCMGNGKKPPHHIREWRRKRGLSQQAVADAVGVDRTQISKIERGAALLDHWLKPLAKTFRVEVSDLFEAPDDVAARKPAIVAGIKKFKGIDPNISEGAQFPPGITRVDQIDIRAGAGGGGEVDSENVTGPEGYTVSKDAVMATWGVPDGYLRELGVNTNGIYLFRSLGDSMLKPDGSGIHSGDVIMADTFDRRPSPPGIFALWDGLGTVVKRVEYVMNSDPPMLNVISDNPAHLPKLLAMEEVNIIGRCVWYGRRL